MLIIKQIRTIAALNSELIALHCGESTLTYGSFINRIDGLALALKNRKIGVGDNVAIDLPHSFEMVIAIFGVLASGAAFVPLEPSNPESRLLAILEDAKPRVLLSYRDNFPVSSDIEVIKTQDWPLTGPISDLSSGISPNAYIIYTSGTTGKPKGVTVGLKALENYINWATSELPFNGGSVPLFTSISFDHALTNIFPPLVKGGKIKIIPNIQGGRLVASELLSNNEHYDYVKITPTLFSFLNKDERAYLGSNCDLLLFGGEKLPPSLIADARRDNSQLTIINHYGPTETTVGCCIFKVPHGFSGTVVPIGKPIPGVEVSIRRNDLSIIALEEIGELYISGNALANGYWEDPEMTKRVFLKIPNDQKDKIWYRTGDLVRSLIDGNIEYVERLDEQIKILGNRIEPAEILYHINNLPNVKQSAVFAIEHKGYSELIAAISFDNFQMDEEGIKTHLLNLIPSIMVPNRYLILNQLPIRVSGKIDVDKLLLMLTKIKNDCTIEDALLEKFQEILSVDTISREDDYFLSGGDSLGTVEVAAWIGEVYDVPVEISCLFYFPTVSLLSQHIRELIFAKDILEK